MPSNRPVTPKESQEWPPVWARSTAFMVGLGLMIWETVVDQAGHLVVYGPAFLLTGLPLARGVEHLLDRLSWVQPAPPPQAPPADRPQQQLEEENTP